jgi:hypothetical protein
MTDPLFAGAVQETVAVVLPLTAVTPVGASGTVAGVTATEGADEADVPTAFVAVTVKVYSVPFVNPVTRQGEVLLEHVTLPGFDVTV